MAILVSSLENIDKLTVKPTEGERHLLIFLRDNLDATYEIYFQPFLNGDRPDIVIMRRDSGVMIIEVKDWNVGSYIYDTDEKMFLNSTEKSPFYQVLSYKENLFNLHIKDLLELKLENHNLFAIISCTVYFHNATEKELYRFERIKKSITKTAGIDLIARDSLTKENLIKMLRKNWLERKSKHFSDKLYDSFKRYLQPPLHTIEQGQEMVLSPKQKELIVSGTVHQKIRGVAGSGKTLVLARRAVNAHKRTKNKVLILTYNISLKNYIHDKISEG